MSNCAITGANGYVGSRLAAFFEKKGHTVFRFTRQSSASSEREVHFVLGEPIAPEEFRKRHIEILIHCAYDFSSKRWQDIYDHNVEGSAALFRAAKEAGVRTSLLVSSMSAFPGCRSLYGRGKWELEQKVLQQKGLVVRSGLVYGQEPGGMMGSLIKNVSSAHFVPVITHPKKSLQLVHEDDLCQLIFNLVTGQIPPSDRPVIAAAPTGWSLKGIVQQLTVRLKKKVQAIPVPWFLAWGAIVFLETLGIQTSFRSDSLLTLGYPDPGPEADAVRLPHVTFREFHQEVL